MKSVDDFDPDSNVYVANLPSDYGKDRLFQLFSKYGQIVRYKFVTPDEPSQPGYGFVQFANRKDAHRAIKNLEGHLFSTGETIYLSIALRRRSSLSEEPTNLYVKNLPASWNNEKLRQVFGAYGAIRQSKVVGDGIGFVRYEDHEQALNAIGRLDKQMVEQGCKLEVRFATRKTAANAYRAQQVPPPTKSNEHNLYIRNLPKFYNQSNLETLFAQYGKISSAKINDNGIAFVRFAHAEDAKRAIVELNGKKPPQFDEEIVVKLAHFDIGDSRNRWANKLGSDRLLNGGGASSATTSNGNHFNNNMYQNHFNAPIGSMNSFNGFGNAYTSSLNGGANQSATPIPSVPSSGAANYSNDGEVNVNVNGVSLQNLSVNSAPQNLQNMNMLQINALQQQMQQWNLQNSAANVQAQGNGAVNGVANLNQFAFPNATPLMMQPPALFANAGSTNTANSTATNNASHPASNGVHVSNGALNLPSTTLPRQGSADSANGAQSPQSNHSGNSTHSNDAHKATWTQKQQQLGDQLYQKVFAKCGAYAPKITGMLIKMGDKKAQQCIDNPQFLDEQIQIAKKLLVQQDSGNEGASNGMMNAQNMNPNTCLSPNALLQQHGASSPTTGNTPLMNRFNANSGTPTGNRFQTLKTKPLTPNGTISNAGNTNTTANAGINVTNPLAAAQLSSIPNLLPNSIPNSLYGTMPTLFGGPQLFAAMSPNSQQQQHSNQGGHTPNNNSNKQQTAQQHTQQQQQQTLQSLQAGQPQYLFTTIPNLGSAPITVTSPAQQQILFGGTPTSLTDPAQMNAIQQSGWGLALNPTATQTTAINVIPTQNATHFMNPSLYPKTQ